VYVFTLINQLSALIGSYSATTVVVPSTSLTIVSPTGVVQISPVGYIANTLAFPNFQGDNVPTNTSSIDSAMQVVLLAAGGQLTMVFTYSTQGALVPRELPSRKLLKDNLVPQSPPPGATAAEMFIGVGIVPNTNDNGYFNQAR
jgi:hypothetical protein